MIDAAAFQQLRPYLFSIAYRMLGSASDAEDVVQDAYLRAASAPADEIRSVKAYLSTVVTRLCLDRLKSARLTREQYVGPWLPEPILTTDGREAETGAERHEWVTLAFLTLLESLSPQERAVFLLREVFDYDYAQIAAMLELSAANCRQLLHRAKARMRGAPVRRHRPEARERQLVEQFMLAIERGDAPAAASLLAENVELTADGGGKVPAAREPLHGRDRVEKLLDGLIRVAGRIFGNARLALTMATVNGEPAVLAWVDDRLETVFVCSVAGDRIDRVYALRNPDKLRHLQRHLTPGHASRS